MDCVSFNRSQLIYTVLKKSINLVSAGQRLIGHYLGLEMRKPVFVGCEQLRCRPACASAQSNQRLCYSLIIKYHIKACYEKKFKFLASFCT